MTGKGPLSDDDELLAAELAFGLLDPVEREAADARLSTDAIFAAAHRHWQDRTVAMLGGRDEQPPPSIWNAVSVRLPANDVRRDSVDVPRPSLRFWQATTGVATAAAIVLAVVAAQRTPAPVQVPSLKVPPLVAVLGGKGGSVVSVSYDRASRRLVVAPSGLAIGQHTAQLWVIPENDVPRSLGLIEASAPGSSPAPAAAELITPGATLAISVEPIGGSPTGQPTGPVIVSGKIVEA